MSTLDEMLDELACADVHVGFPEQRAELARRMLHEGVSAEDVGLLAGHCIGTVSGGAAAAARVLVSLLTDPAKRDARLSDLRAVQGAKQRRKAETSRAPGDAPTRPFAGPTEGEDPKVWDHDRMCRIAFCRVVKDHRSREHVARELGVSPTTIGVMIDRGREISRSPLLKPGAKPATIASAEKGEREQNERRLEFRERMRTDAVRRSAKPARHLDFARIRKEQAALLARIRKDGLVDLAEVFRDPVKRGALAELEADGHVLRVGEPDPLHRQPYRVAHSDSERKEFREQLSIWNRQDEQRPRRREASA